jgi:pyruvate ferredoxin oxidoreductase gamma subunit
MKVIDFDYQYCKGCAVCADVCPTGAIKMVREI